MAVVFLARDPVMKRQVAIKLLPRQLTFEEQFRTRFQREAELIASLEHHAIVPIYDFGDEQEQPFLVMRYMAGGTLHERLARGPLPVGEVVRILERVAEGLEEAHARHIIHRDIKPGNILFDARGFSYLSDFGIAKVSESSAFTGTGVIGTPEYMSPEQARGLKVDARADVYSLAVVVFEALSGQLPYKADTPMGVAVAHITEPVPSILRFKPDLPDAYDRVLTRAMAKDPAERYASPTELVAALRELSGAAPGSVPPAHQRAAASAAPVRPAARPALAQAALLQTAPRTITVETVQWVKRLLVLRGHTGLVWSVAFNPRGDLLASAGNDQTAQIWVTSLGLHMHTLTGHTDVVWCVAFSPDGRLLATGGRDAALQLWEVGAGQPVRRIALAQGVTSVAFSPDGRTVACGTTDAAVTLWDVETGQRRRSIRGHNKRISSVAFSPDGATLATASLDGMVRLWNAAGLTGSLPPLLEGKLGYAWSVAFSPDGKQVACAADKVVRLWDTATGKVEKTLEGHTGTVNCVAFGPDGLVLASGTADKHIHLWDVREGRPLRTLDGHGADINSLAFSADGHRLASASADATVALWGFD